MCASISYSLFLLWDGTLAPISYVSSITSISVSLLLVNHEPCLTLLLPMHRSGLLPLLHRQRRLSIVCPLLLSVMFRPHFGHGIMLRGCPVFWRNSSAFSQSSDRDTTNILVATPFRPMRLRPNDVGGNLPFILNSFWHFFATPSNPNAILPKLADNVCA